ncbi:MAG: hypothetical protein EPO10_17480 [Reyranella sp.]|uniref:hypothetical protein n=1 Tax=Reyranella sp. TaxID=1929291 RepID=UPI001217B2AC|nr:hypothetical protein [Reyranella sp.]TAJ90287.1 MAG: hypothetical protein EPO41_17785 [Reyranella sp.]TBR27559.1 MAG: hypothetical protein EPO10_17480 [Reyranella sp.]
MALSRVVRGFTVALASSLILAAGVVAPVSAQQWTEVNESKFKVEMPGPPERSVQEVTVNGTGEVADQIERTVTLGATEYFFSHTPYRKMPADLTPAQMLLNSRDGRPGHLLADRQLTVSGAPARDFVHEEDGWILATRAIYAGDTLYQLIVVGRAGVQTAPATRRFFESFTLAPRRDP